ncbi:MAG: SDR family NAD(P)-dependent oxidoreductase [Deltaproteobacteria bacterium]
MTERRAAIVTGATRGIGRGIFERLIGEGISVATVYHRDKKAASIIEKKARQAGVDCMIEKIDVTDDEGMEIFVKQAAERFGRVDYLVNNVGGDIFKTIYDMSMDEWFASQHLILNAPVFLCKQVLPYMRRQHFGRIVNLGASSKNYIQGTPGLSPFGIHKAALTVFTRTLALEEIGHGITVNMVAPGSTRGAGGKPEEARLPVSGIPIGRRVEIAEVVEPVMYFLSDAAAAVTGQVIGVNGGMST